mgnify:FL=1
MAEISFIILGIIILFFILLAAKDIIGKNKNRIKDNFCVVCVSISLTWIFLFGLYLFGLFDNILIVSLLMGMSITGIYYFIDKKIGKVNKKLNVFRLPFILTLIIIAYYFLTFERIIISILIVAGLWILFALIYTYNNTKFIKKLLECCKE